MRGSHECYVPLHALYQLHGHHCRDRVPGFIALFYLASTEKDPRPGPSLAVLNIIALGPILLLGVGGPWMILESIRNRLTVRDDRVTKVSAFGTTEIDLRCVTEARWKRRQGTGRLELRTETGKLCIDFPLYPAADARQLIRFFRARLPESIQTNWEAYWANAWQIFDEPDPGRREEFAAATRALRRRMAVWISLGTVLIVIAGVIAWRITGDAKALCSIALCIFLLPALFFRADRGKIGDRPERARGSIRSTAFCW